MDPIVVLMAMAGVILVGSAIATGVEAAILTVNPIQVHTLTQQRVPGARALERIKARPGRALALLVVLARLLKPTVMGLESAPLNATPNKKSFQIWVNCQITVTTMMGSDKGRKIDQNMR